MLSVNDYEEFPPLWQANTDALALRDVLSDPDIGAFSHVEAHLDFDSNSAKRALERCVAECQEDDVLLLHIGSHMSISDTGSLLIIPADASVENWKTQSISGDWLVKQLNSCRSRRVLLILDGCWAGGIDSSFRGLPDFDAANALGLAGRGRIVFASAGMGPAQERPGSEDRPASFTDVLVRGLRSGDADTDQDGYVSAFELFEYAYEQCVIHFPGQQPSLKLFGGTPASIRVAWSKRASASLAIPGSWSIEVQRLLAARTSDDPEERESCLWLIFHLLKSPNLENRKTAVVALFEMLEDPDPYLRHMAQVGISRGKNLRSSLLSTSGQIVADYSQLVININQFGGELTTGDFNVLKSGEDAKGNAVGRKNKVQYAEFSTPTSKQDVLNGINLLAEQVSGDSDLAWQDKAAALEALGWWHENLDAESEPAEAREKVSTLRRVGGSVWSRFYGLMAAMPEAMAAAWVVEVIKHFAGA